MGILVILVVFFIFLEVWISKGHVGDIYFGDFYNSLDMG